VEVETTTVGCEKETEMSEIHWVGLRTRRKPPSGDVPRNNFTILVRLDRALKERIDDRSRKSAVSLNCLALSALTAFLDKLDQLDAEAAHDS
jgi:hypothetical protein